ncbi:hypothetical protein, partial [Gluconobacter wancherniae]|uniref:hypothetical protein n=1 Tax=Gluconobacter wancherniae TaxID=1307955 RepID=UPI001B8C1C4C
QFHIQFSKTKFPAAPEPLERSPPRREALSSQGSPFLSTAFSQKLHIFCESPKKPLFSVKNSYVSSHNLCQELR